MTPGTNSWHIVQRIYCKILSARVTIFVENSKVAHRATNVQFVRPDIIENWHSTFKKQVNRRIYGWPAFGRSNYVEGKISVAQLYHIVIVQSHLTLGWRLDLSGNNLCGGQM